MEKTDLERAYSLKTKDEARALYADWAETYDAEFGQAMGYAAPRRVAEIFLAEGGEAPVLDIGAGTGLVAENLHGLEVDGLDLSPEMLAVAARKGLYRRVIEADLTKVLPMPDEAYGGALSAGTFTHGHVGPGCLPELLRVVRPGGLFVCSVVPAVFDGMRFGSTLAQLQAAGRISALRFQEFQLYDGATHDHADDTGLAVIFHRV